MFADHPELRSLESIMTNINCCVYFKLYLSQKLQLENYTFWNEVDKFKAKFLYSSERISHHYIEEGAISEVNIDALMRKECLDNVKKGTVGVTTFARCQAELYKVLNQNNYHNFLASEYCQEYMLKKKQGIDLKPEKSLSIINMKGSPSGGSFRQVGSPAGSLRML
jgi:hypothetical protein